ncbi:MAG: MarR family transcriptional regulator [Anaplasmataceae bacterium]|nr:MarR family transcriptional regulator [Anaplasmataceae bacterium]
MDSRLIKALQTAHLTIPEAKAYLALWEVGEATVQQLAERASLQRTSLYSILKKLEKRNLVFKTVRKKHTYFIPTDPQHILEDLRNRTEHFAKILPSFVPVYPESSTKPRIYFLSGSEGFKKIWRSVFDSKEKEYLIITDPREMLGFVKRGYIKGTIIKEKLKKGIKSRQLLSFSEYGKKVMEDDAKENRQSKILPHTYRVSCTTIIFGNKVAFISPSPENIMLIIESESFAKSQRTLFEAFWDLIK